jgi:PAS domain S-box-containing protein
MDTQELDDIRLLLTEVVDELGPVAVMTALRDCDDTIVDFRYDYVNPAFCQTVGESAEALLGNRLLELYPSHVELGLFDAYRDAVDTGEPFVSELPWFDERNVQAYLEVRVTRFRDGYLMSGQDITARKMAEQAQHMLDTTLHADPRSEPVPPTRRPGPTRRRPAAGREHGRGVVPVDRAVGTGFRGVPPRRLGARAPHHRPRRAARVVPPGPGAPGPAEGLDGLVIGVEHPRVLPSTNSRTDGRQLAFTVLHEDAVLRGRRVDGWSSGAVS